MRIFHILCRKAEESRRIFLWMSKYASVRNGWKVLNYVCIIHNVIVPSFPRPWMPYKQNENTVSGIKKKRIGCKSKVIPLLGWLLWWAGLTSLNAFVVCTKWATSFTGKLPNTSPHLIPTPCESWLSPIDCLFPFATGILSWPGGLFLLCV